MWLWITSVIIIFYRLKKEVFIENEEIKRHKLQILKKLANITNMKMPRKEMLLLNCVTHFVNIIFTTFFVIMNDF